MARQFSNTTVETTLVSSVSNSDTLIDVVDDTGFPAMFPFSLIIDFQSSTVEVVTVTGTAGASYTVTRGQDGTAAQSHNAGAVVVHGVTARDLQEPQDHIDASMDVHGIGATADTVGTDTAQVLTNKTIAAASNTLTVALDDLSDVTTSGASDGDILVLNSGTWQPATDPRPGQLVAQLFRSTSQSIPSFTEVQIAWNASDLDLLSGWNAGVNPSRYTPPLAGWYELTGKVSFTSSASGTYRAVGWKKNGSYVTGGYARYVINGTIASWEYGIPAPTISVLLNGSTDYVEMFGEQATLGSLNTVTSARHHPFMSVKYVGPA